MTRIHQASLFEDQSTGMNPCGRQESTHRQEISYSTLTKINTNESYTHCTRKDGQSEACGGWKRISHTAAQRWKWAPGTNATVTCQLRYWAMVSKDVTSNSRSWKILYRDNNSSISSQQHPLSRPHWITIRTQQHASYDWSLTPWNPKTPLPSEKLRDVWVNVITEY